jgi:hypothetical protein
MGCFCSLFCCTIAVDGNDLVATLTVGWTAIFLFTISAAASITTITPVEISFFKGLNGATKHYVYNNYTIPGFPCCRDQFFLGQYKSVP